jgi:NTP pyrophosphatase (non-canonical NTP hydrolase)
MTDEDKKDLMLLSIKTFGEQSQIDQLHEEIGELMVALNHYKRGRVNLTKVIEEIVDVEQCLDTIKTLLQINPEEYNTIENQQWNKMKKQIQERNV